MPVGTGGRNKPPGFCFVLFSADPPRPLGFRHQASRTLAGAGGAEVGILRELRLMEYLGFTLKVARLEATHPQRTRAGSWAPEPTGDAPLALLFFLRPRETPRHIRTLLRGRLCKCGQSRQRGAPVAVLPLPGPVEAICWPDTGPEAHRKWASGVCGTQSLEEDRL